MDVLVKNIGTIAVFLILALIVFLIVRYMKKEKTAGRSSCGAGCAGCAMRGKCHEKKK